MTKEPLSATDIQAIRDRRSMSVVVPGEWTEYWQSQHHADVGALLAELERKTAMGQFLEGEAQGFEILQERLARGDFG